jgi:hypothetical protein
MRGIPGFVDRVVRLFLGYTRESVDLFKAEIVSDSPSTIYSAPVRPLFAPFVLYLYIISTGVGDHVVTFTWQYFDERSGRWYALDEGIWATLSFEDVDTASGLARCFHGDFSGKSARLEATCTGGSSLLYFTVSACIDFVAVEAEQ